MKTSFKSLTFAALAMAGLSFSSLGAENYTVLRICEDQHVLKTSDGQEAGHIEYIVLEPGQQRVVSTVITGGIVGARHVAVPFSEFQMTGEREVVLRGITREHIVSAPVIEVERFRTSTVVEPAFFEKSVTHFRRDPVERDERTRAVIEKREQRPLAPGEPRIAPVTTERIEREPRTLPPAGGVREKRLEGQTKIERETPTGRLPAQTQAPAPGAPPAEETPGRVRRHNDPADGAREEAPAKTRKEKSADVDSRTVVPEGKARGELPAADKVPDSKRDKKKEDSEKPGTPGDREKRLERTEKEAGAVIKQARKGEPEKDEKSDRPASEKGERKAPKTEENR